MSAADFEIAPEVLDKLEAAIRADPERVYQLTEDQRVQAAVDIMAARNTVYKRDIWRWLRETVWTIDEASQEQIKWPDKAYLRELFAVLDAERMIAIPKSRRMMVTWAVAAWAVHKARFFPNYAIFIQSETEDKAAFVVDKRCAFIEDHMEPPVFRREYNSIRTTKGAIGRMTYKQTGSYIWGIPQGGDVIRTYTPSVLILDEAEFQPEAHQALIAALPAVEKGAKLVLVSSSNGPGGVIAEICKGIGFTRWVA